MCSRHAAGDRQHRGMIFMRLIQARDQMIGTGAGGAATNRQPTGQLGLACSSECGAFFVPYPYPLHAFLPAYGVGKRIERVAHHAKNLTDTNFVQCSDQKLSDGLLHFILLA